MASSVVVVVLTAFLSSLSLCVLLRPRVNMETRFNSSVSENQWYHQQHTHTDNDGTLATGDSSAGDQDFPLEQNLRCQFCCCRPSQFQHDVFLTNIVTVGFMACLTGSPGRRCGGGLLFGVDESTVHEEPVVMSRSDSTSIFKVAAKVVTHASSTSAPPSCCRAALF